MSWSKEFHGIRHRTDLPKSHQISMIDRGSFHEVFMLHLHGNKPFHAIQEHFGTEDECIKAAEKWAASIK